jgi:hypothetical protein
MPLSSAGLNLSSPNPSLQLSLIDSTFAEVATGTGGLVRDGLAPGIYELRISAGAATDTRLLRLGPGETLQERVEVAFGAAAPLPGTTTWDEDHERAATRGSEHLVETGRSGEGGLLVMARGTGRGSDPAPPGFEVTPGSIERSAGDKRSWRDEGPDWRLRAAPAAPGGYGLSSLREEILVEQSVWVAAGWQTLVFLPYGSRGPEAGRASVVMFPIEEAWRPAVTEATSRAAELALSGLRERRSVLPSDLLDLLLDEKFREPMLGLLGAHSLLLEPKIDFERFDLVLGNLERLVPGLPDVAGLRVLGEEARPYPLRRSAPSSAISALKLDWPPMLVAAYTALIRLDARCDGGVIVEGSRAQTAAGQLTGDGVWTGWTSQRRSPPRRRKRRSRRLRRPHSAVGESLRELDTQEPDTQRVADYLATVADADAPDSLNAILDTELGQPERLSAATSVPLRSVHSALDTIKENLDQPA